MDFMTYLHKRIFITAEIGNNHNGNIDTAKKLIDAASEAGVDAVKFQTFRGTDIVAPNILSSEYPGWAVSEYTYWHEFLDSIALPLEKHREVFSYAQGKELFVFSTPTSPAMVDFLEGLAVPVYKIASMDMTNIFLLQRIAQTHKPVILSTGMASDREIEKAASFFDPQKLVILHCVSDYPLDYINANLRTIPYLHKKFGCLVGFSDHSLGCELSLAAVACGARFIEKHITLDRHSSLKAEHHFSLEPDELKAFVKKIREIESALGKEEIVRSDKEVELARKARRSLHVNKPLSRGHVLREEDIAVVRPANGEAPEEFLFFIGRRISRDKSIWEPLKKEDVA